MKTFMTSVFLLLAASTAAAAYEEYASIESSVNTEDSFDNAFGSESELSIFSEDEEAELFSSTEDEANFELSEFIGLGNRNFNRCVQRCIDNDSSRIDRQVLRRRCERQCPQNDTPRPTRRPINNPRPNPPIRDRCVRQCVARDRSRLAPEEVRRRCERQCRQENTPRPTNRPARRPTPRPTPNQPNRCVGNERPRPRRTDADKARYRFNLSGSNKQCTDLSGNLYQYGQFNNIKSFEDCADKCVTGVPLSLANDRESFRGIDFDCGRSQCRCLYDRNTLGRRNSNVFDRTNTSRGDRGYGSIDRSGGRQASNFYCGTLVDSMEAEFFLEADASKVE